MTIKIEVSSAVLSSLIISSRTNDLTILLHYLSSSFALPSSSSPLTLQDYRNNQNLRVVAVGETRTSTDVILAGISKNVGAKKENLDSTVRFVWSERHACPSF